MAINVDAINTGLNLTADAVNVMDLDTAIFMEAAIDEYEICLDETVYFRQLGEAMVSLNKYKKAASQLAA